MNKKKVNKVNLGILFADVIGSTRLFEMLGDDAARTLIADRLNLLNLVIKKNSGKLVKTLGDGIICVFAKVDTTANAATEMQEILDEEATIGSIQPVIISIGIGFHFGPVLLEAGDIFGDTVNVAARMASLSKGQQIITTKSTVNRLSKKWQASTRFIDRTIVKGKKEEIDIYELIWQVDDVTRTSTRLREVKEISIGKTPKKAEMEIHYLSISLVINKDCPNIIIGRDKYCDLPVNARLASRQHIRIELRRDRFFVIDNSTNGTYIHTNGSSSHYLRREERVIDEDVSITLGTASKNDQENIIKLTLK